MAITNDDSIVTKGILRYFYNSIHTNLTNLLKKKVDIEDGKGLSTNDFTDAEKEKLEGLENYSLPTATDDTLGGIKTSYTESGQTYAVKTDVEGNAYVSVPWTDTDTEYEVVSTTSNGLAPMLPDVDDGSTYYLNGLGKWSVVSTDSYFSVTSEY